MVAVLFILKKKIILIGFNVDCQNICQLISKYRQFKLIMNVETFNDMSKELLTSENSFALRKRSYLHPCPLSCLYLMDYCRNDNYIIYFDYICVVINVDDNTVTCYDSLHVFYCYQSAFNNLQTVHLDCKTNTNGLYAN